MPTIIPDKQPGTTHEAQLAKRVEELLPDLNLTERLELLGVMDPDDMRTSLGWLAGAYPAVFDAVLVRDRELTGRLTSRLADDEADEEPFCGQCGATVGHFLDHGDNWHHFRGEGTADRPVELYDAGHEPKVAWRPAGAR